MNATPLDATVLHHPALDDTVEYQIGRSRPVPPGARHTDEPDTPEPAAGPCPGCRRRFALGLVWVVVVLLGIGAGAWLAGQWGEPAQGVEAAASPSPAPSAATSAATSPAPQKPKSVPADAGQSGTQDPEPAGPCDGVASGLVAAQNPVHLEPGETMGSVVIHHCGEGDVGWWAQSKPYVMFEHTAGTLGEGASLSLKFSVDPSGLPPGEYSFPIKVSWPGHHSYVTVHGSHTP